jgi:HEAT repeat protein
VREAAQREIEAGGAKVREPALRSLGSADETIRLGAARALARVADGSCAAPLIAALARANDQEARALSQALARTATKEAGDALVAQIEASDERRAFAAATALEDFAGPLDFARLRAAADEGRPARVRQTALMALGAHASPQDRALFLAASNSETIVIRAAAIHGLFAAGGATEDDVRRLLLSDAEEAVRAEAAWRAAILPGAIAIGPLKQALYAFKDDDAVPAAIRALSEHHEPAAYDALQEFVLDDTQPAGLRGAAARGMAAIDRGRTEEFLKRESAVFDSELRVDCDQILASRASR